MKMLYRLICFLVFLGLGIHANAQFSNPDFEDASDCPSTLGQVFLMDNWFTVVESADYYDCGFSENGFFPEEIDGAYSGEGYIGFASYGDGTGSAESVGQELPAPLVVGEEYEFSIAAKTTNGGPYSEDCTGVCLYGFTSAPPTGIVANHTSLLAGAIELACTPDVFNTLWETFDISFVATDPITHVVISPGLAPGCGQCIFVDDLDIQSSESSEIVTFCDGDNVTLDAELGGGTNWYSVEGGVATFIQTSSTYELTPTDGQQIQAEFDDTILLYTLNVVEVPAVDLGPDLQLCTGTLASFDVDNGYDEVYWNGELGAPVFEVGEDLILEVEVFLDGCSLTDEVEIEYAETPHFDSLILTDASCPGTCNASISLSPDVGWEYSIDGAVANNVTLDLCEGGYSLELVNDWCSAQTDVELVALDAPIIELTPDQTICEGTATTIVCSSGYPEMVYTWSNGDVGAIQEYTPDAPTQYCVTGEVDGCASAELCVDIDFHPEFSIDASSDITICPGDPVVLNVTASGGEGSYSYSWTNEDGEVLSNTDEYMGNPTEDGTISINVSDPCVIFGLNADILVDVEEFAFPEPTLAQDQDCVPITFSGSFEEDDQIATISWQLSDGSLLAGDNIDVIFEESGCYNADVTISTLAGCSYDQSFANVACGQPIPVADFGIPRGTILQAESDPVDIVNLSIGAETYQWFFDGELFSEEENPTFEVPYFDKEYTICLEVTSEYGCVDELCTPIIVIPEPHVYIPSAFTPDQDGINESFYPILNFEPDFYEFAVFNRWGDRIFVSQIPGVGWIGNSDLGEYYVPNGVYSWALTARRNSDQLLIDKRGTVLILR